MPLHPFRSGAVTFLFCCITLLSVFGAEAKDFSEFPQFQQAPKIRIGYLEGGPYRNYHQSLVSFINGLVKLGWLEDPRFPEFSIMNNSREVWEWLVAHTKSDYLVFVKDGFYSSEWNKTLRPETRQTILNRLVKNPDFDFMIAMGTWAGQDLANERNQVPTMVFSSSEPVKANIVKGAQYSGISNLHARTDPFRYERQVRLFHDQVGFQKLGVAYEDSPDGRVYSAIDDIRKVAQERGFEIVECFTLNNTPDIHLANASVSKCYQDLAEKVDAFYITNQTGVNEENMPKLMAPLFAKRIPTFSQPGVEIVKFGALMGIDNSKFKEVAEFHAKAAGKIFNGAKAGDLPMIFEDPARLVLNLETASRIGYTPSAEVLVAADQIFRAIEQPETTRDFSISPTTNNGKKWRIGYIQGGSYKSYQKSLVAIVEGLMGLGWIERQTVPPQENDMDTDKLWAWMASKIESDYLEFRPDAHYSANWDKKQRPLVKAELIDRLYTKNDLDLIVAMGTWAGQDLANNQHHTPTLVASTTDPIEGKIIKSAKDSGYDHIHAKIDPDRHERQVRIFYDFFKFKKLGVAFENTEEGRAIGAIGNIEKMSDQLGFELVTCYAGFSELSQEQSEKNISQCYLELAPKIDAAFIARHPGVSLSNLPNILAPLNKYKVPSFSQGLSDEVKHGTLLSVSVRDFSGIGTFYATTMAKIFNGAKPRQINQIFENPPKFAINMETAKKIGYNPPIEVLSAVDEI
ncbi:MAG: hypothetical protein C0614_06415 [Desulfuromonas sp.]|nr:MAG: hypothetical protein C0614_06415 [Desulfuromonas sp.]